MGTLGQRPRSTDSAVMLRRLLLLLLLFYAVSYALSGVLLAAFGLTAHYDGTLPFDHTRFGFGGPSYHLAAWLNLVLSYALSLLWMVFVVRDARQAWDYAVSLSIIHWALSCAVMTSFPVNWVWWVTMLGCTLFLWFIGEILVHLFIVSGQEIAVDHQE